MSDKGKNNFKKINLNRDCIEATIKKYCTIVDKEDNDDKYTVYKLKKDENVKTLAMLNFLLLRKNF